MHYQVGRNSRGWLGWWERCMKNRPVHLCESFGNMGAEVIPSEAEMSIVQSQESYVFREPVSISEEVVYVGAHKFDHGNGCMLIMGMTLPPLFCPVLEFRILETKPFLPVSLTPPNFVLRRSYVFPLPSRCDTLSVMPQIKMPTGQSSWYYK